ncbi:CAP domain-containing protein [Streptomyces sp. NPDC005820]|uniref:CAP domain-containing protein n=1 Tax=Streptomyces sp. NPDC005820 TaxID=3157069 RepID=UPI00340FDE11
MTKHRQKPKRRKTAAISVVAVAAVGIPSVAMASGDGTSGGWRVVSFPWWGWGTSRPAAEATSSPSPVISVTPSATRASATATLSSTPSATPSGATTSPSPSATAGPTGTPTATPSEAPTSAAPTPKATSSAADTDSGPTDRVLELVNAERKKAGCSALTENAKLTKAAQDHSQDMADHQNMSHTGSDGSSMSDRLSRVGYAFRSAGENVAAGYGTPESVMDGWMNSAGHKANILNCGFKEIGVGLAQPGNYWTQDFGSTA